MPRTDTGKTPSYNKRASIKYYQKMKDDPVFKEKRRIRNEALKEKLKIKRRQIKEQKAKYAQAAIDNDNADTINDDNTTPTESKPKPQTTKSTDLTQSTDSQFNDTMLLLMLMKKLNLDPSILPTLSNTV